MRYLLISVLILSNLSAFADESIIATCVPFYFHYKSKERITQILKAENQYKLQRLLYAGRDSPLEINGDNVDVKLSSEDNGFSLKLSTFRYELIAKDISKTELLKSYDQENLFGKITTHPDSLIYAGLKDKVGHQFVGEKVFLATIRYVEANKTSNDEYACYAPKFSTLVEDSKGK